jgi:hypothetical protein
MKYCHQTTKSHPIASEYFSCLENINLLIERESRDCKNCVIPTFEKNEIVLNLDAVESTKKDHLRIPRNKTMDMAFGLKDFNENINEFIIVELRLNYQNPNNLNKELIDGKVNGSIELLNNHLAIHSKFIFVFKTNQIKEAENRLFRMIPKVNSNYVVMDLQMLKSAYFD